MNKEEERKIALMLHRYSFKYKLRTGRNPDEKLLNKERERIIKKFFLGDKTGLHQSEKEDGQMNCLLEILRIERKHLSPEEMSQILIESGFKVGSSIKTIYRRILPLLVERGAIKDEDNKYYIPEYKRNPEFEKRMADEMTSRIETVSILYNFLETLKNTPVYKKAKEYVEDELRVNRERAARARKKRFDENVIMSRVIFMGAPVAKVQDGIWETLNSAMQENLHVQIQYVAEGSRKTEKYTVQPYQLIYDNGFWELWGNCTSAGHRGTRLFNLCRIESVEVLERNERFMLPEIYDFRATLAGHFGCYNDEVVENYRIKIKKDSYAYIYIKDRIWGDFQEIKKTKGGYLLEFEATQYKPILRWVLSWGPEVEPLEPKKLVDDWKEKIRQMKDMI